MILTPEIRERLKSVMLAKRVTGYTIKEKLGISATTVGNYVNADSKTKKADSIKIVAICKCLGITPEWLEYGFDTVKSPEEEEEGTELTNEEFITKSIEDIRSKLESVQDQYSVLRKDNVTLNRRLDDITKVLLSMQKDLLELNKK